MYKELKRLVQREIRWAYWKYIEDIITPDHNDDKQPNCMKRFWTFINTKDLTEMKSTTKWRVITLKPRWKSQHSKHPVSISILREIRSTTRIRTWTKFIPLLHKRHVRRNPLQWQNNQRIDGGRILVEVLYTSLGYFFFYSNGKYFIIKYLP